MATTIIVNGSPYGSESPYNALRLAAALGTRKEWVELFLMGDGVYAARRGQEPRGAHASIEAALRELLDDGASVTLCGTCCTTRGLSESDVIDGVRIGTIHDLADLIVSSDRVVPF